MQSSLSDLPILDIDMLYLDLLDKGDTHICLYLCVTQWEIHSDIADCRSFLAAYNLPVAGVSGYIIAKEYKGSTHRIVGYLVPNDIASLYLLVSGIGISGISDISLDSYSEWTDAIVALR